MTLQNLKKDDLNLLDRFEQFYLDRNVHGFWAGTTRLKCGTYATTDPRDVPPMLWRGNLKAYSAADILAEVAEHAATLGVRPGFALSPGWGPQVGQFADMLARCGYRNEETYSWYTLDLRSFVPDAPDPEVTVEQTRDLDNFARLLGDIYGADLERVFRVAASRQPDAPHRRFFLARNRKGDAMGCAVATFGAGLAYLNCLGVLAPYRDRNVAAALVSARLEFLRGQGVRDCFSSVELRNATSRKIQEKTGYRPLSRVAYWVGGAT